MMHKISDQEAATGCPPRHVFANGTYWDPENLNACRGRPYHNFDASDDKKLQLFLRLGGLLGVLRAFSQGKTRPQAAQRMYQNATKSCTPMPTTTFSSVGRAFGVLPVVSQGKTCPQTAQRAPQNGTKSCTPMPTTSFSWVGRAFGLLQAQNRKPLSRTRGAFKES